MQVRVHASRSQDEQNLLPMCRGSPSKAPRSQQYHSRNMNLQSSRPQRRPSQATGRSREWRRGGLQRVAVTKFLHGAGFDARGCLWLMLSLGLRVLLVVGFENPLKGRA